MNKETLTELIKNPSLLTPQYESELKQMTKVYPYFQAIYVLYAKAHLTNDTIEKAAVRSLDRNLLRNILIKNYNPNQGDALVHLLKNVEQVNAFEKLKADKITTEKPQEEEWSIKENTKKGEVTDKVIQIDESDESVASIIYNSQDDLHLEKLKTDAWEEKFISPIDDDIVLDFQKEVASFDSELSIDDEPTYNPFANDLFDKEIEIDEDVRTQTEFLVYNDELVKPITDDSEEQPVVYPEKFEYEIEKQENDYSLEVQQIVNTLPNFITSTDNFFEEATIEINKFDINKELEKEVTEIESLSNPIEENFFADFSSEKENQLLDTYYLRKEEETIASRTEEISEYIDEDKITLEIDAYYLRKEEEAIEFANLLPASEVSEEIAEVAAVSIDLLDAYYLRKEEE
ncbi:hypothetical protein, partial [Thermoflexibacter ruber]